MNLPKSETLMFMRSNPRAKTLAHFSITSGINYYILIFCLNCIIRKYVNNKIYEITFIKKFMKWKKKIIIVLCNR